MFHNNKLKFWGQIQNILFKKFLTQEAKSEKSVQSDTIKIEWISFVDSEPNDFSTLSRMNPKQKAWKTQSSI